MPTTTLADVARALPPLSQMARDVRDGGSLRRSTAAVMWLAYGAHAAITARALARPDDRLPVPRPVAPLGWLGVVAGGALCLAGMRRFASPGEIEGTRHDALTVDGVYRWSRTPQYLGYLVGLGGAAVARRSLLGAVATGAVAVVYAAWIPVEEQQLRALYGQDYLDYLRTTNRWWGDARA